MTTQLEKDLQHTYASLSKDERQKFFGGTILITGSAGFIGYYLTNFFQRFRAELRLKKSSAWIILCWVVPRGSTKFPTSTSPLKSST